MLYIYIYILFKDAYQTVIISGNRRGTSSTSIPWPWPLCRPFCRGGEWCWLEWDACSNRSGRKPRGVCLQCMWVCVAQVAIEFIWEPYLWVWTIGSKKYPISSSITTDNPNTSTSHNPSSACNQKILRFCFHLVSRQTTYRVKNPNYPGHWRPVWRPCSTRHCLSLRRSRTKRMHLPQQHLLVWYPRRFKHHLPKR